jgi:hypothetical protein
MLYKYPQAAFPYEQLIKENRTRGTDQPEYELIDTGIFDDQRYFDVVIEYGGDVFQQIIDCECEDFSFANFFKKFRLLLI